MSLVESSIQALIEKSKEDLKSLKLIEKCLVSFEEYHSRIFKQQIFIKLYSFHNMQTEDHQSELERLDKSRTMSHNTVISNIEILNRLCQQNNIPIVYTGEVSKDRPYRVEIADAVLAYVEEVVEKRHK